MADKADVKVKGKCIADMTPEERREAGRKGGIKSGEVKRKKKKMREAFDVLLSMPLNNKKFCDIEEVKSFADLKKKNISVQEAVAITMIQRAMMGDVKAAEFIRDTSGQKPVDNVSLSGEINNPFAELTTEELRQLIDYD